MRHVDVGSPAVSGDVEDDEGWENAVLGAVSDAPQLALGEVF